MPMVFVHGVNTRLGDTDSQRKAFADRIDLLKQMFRTAFADRVTVADKLQIFAPYWGEFGASFRRNLASCRMARTRRSPLPTRIGRPRRWRSRASWMPTSQEIPPPGTILSLPSPEPVH